MRTTNLAKSLMFKDRVPKVGDKFVVRRRYTLRNGDTLLLGAKYEVFRVRGSAFDIKHIGWDTGAHNLLRKKRRMRI